MFLMIIFILFFWTSFLALASATLSDVALSSRYRSICRPNRPPLELISLITILATFALAIPKNESGPVMSVTTPTLMDRRADVVDSVIAFLLSQFVDRRRLSSQG